MQSRIAGARTSGGGGSGGSARPTSFTPEKSRLPAPWSKEMDENNKVDMSLVDAKMKQLRLWGTVQAGIAMASVLLSVLQVELSFSALTVYGTRPETSAFINFLKALSTVAAVILLYTIVQYYLVLVDYQIARCQLPRRCSLVSSGNLPLMILELVICSFHCPPFVHFAGSYNLQDLLCALIFLRVYLVFRFLAVRSRLFTPSGRFIENLTRSEFDYAMVFKMSLYRQPLLSLLFVFGTLMIVSSYCIFIFERWAAFLTPETDDDNRMHLTNIAWLTFITVFTVGYGDIYPITHEGRFVAIMAAMMGTSITALLIAVVSNVLQLNETEQKVVQFMDRDEYRKRIKECAARCIQLAYFKWKGEAGSRPARLSYRHSYRHEPVRPLSPQDLEVDLYSHLRMWRELKRIGRQVQQDADISGEIAITELRGVVDGVAADLRELTARVHQALGLPPPQPKEKRPSLRPSSRPGQRRTPEPGQVRSAGPPLQPPPGAPLPPWAPPHGYGAGGPGRAVALFDPSGQPFHPHDPAHGRVAGGYDL